MTTTTITGYYGEDHDRLDGLFETFRDLKRTDFDKAKEALREFKFGLQRHIVWEEEILFPLFEEKTGIPNGGPTVVMRQEHREISAILEAIHEKVKQQDLDSNIDEQRLLTILGNHNIVEESILYPTIDRSISHADQSGAFRKMSELPEERYINR